MKALYRKYRPTKLSEVVGESQVVDSLEQSLKKHKISHAYLFTGPRGCGKTSVARIFAHEINGFKYELEDSYIDIIEIDAASNTGVDDIRELRERATTAPAEGKYKVYIIDEVHMLSKSAFNALLKTLEEPPEHVVFIMATTDAYKVPITITSRSQVFNFKLADEKTMFEHLKNIAKQEKIKIADDAINAIVRQGGGSFRDSLSLLDQIATLADKNEITLEYLEKALGLPEDQIITQLIETYTSGDLSAISTQIQSLINSGIKPETIASEVINRIIKNPTRETLALLKTLPEVSGQFSEAKLLLAFTTNQITTPTVHPVAPVQLASAPAQPKPRPVAKTKPEAKPVSPEPAPTKTIPSTFDQGVFLKSIESFSPSLYNILSRCQISAEGKNITIVTERAIHQKVLSTKNNSTIIASNIPPDYQFQILKPDNSAPKDPTLSKISDIMGNVQEVKTDDGNPF